MLNQKVSWIKKWSEQHSSDISVLNGALADDFATAFDSRLIVDDLGAKKCPDLGKTLSKAFKLGLMTRRKVGIPSNEGKEGYPNWVYVYYDTEKEMVFQN